MSTSSPEDQVRERTRELSLQNEALRRSLSALREDQTQLVIQTMGLFEKIVAGLSHGLNTPLGILTSNFDTAARSFSKIQKEVETLQGYSARLQPLFETGLSLMEMNQEACSRITQLVNSLKSFVRLDEASFKESDINEGLESTLALLQPELDDRIQVTTELAELPRIPCCPDQLNLVFLSLLLEACKAIQGEGEIRIVSRVENEHVQVLISHTADELEEPTSGQASGSETDLNLSVLAQVIRSQQGDLELERDAVGRRFVIQLPMRVQAPSTLPR